jgi:membrane protease YdiL (CAAX protease family)
VITAGVLKAYFPLHSFRELFARFGLLPFANARPVLASLAAGIALVLLFRYVLQDAFPPPERAAIHPANIINSGSTADKLVFVFGAAMLAPVAEEFLFRGVLYDGVSSSSNKPVAAVLVTVAFIFLHPATVSTGYWLTHALLYVTACLLMLIREMTGGLPAPIAFHAGVNGASLLL